ncbi:MAG: multiheme c-type cytochrome [Myxococcales bacterium]
MQSTRFGVLGFALGWSMLAACGGGGDDPSQGDASVVPPTRMSREELMNPVTCSGCHPRHYREWSSSMHAYASKDPVFLAMNQRGQRETYGQMGDFCVGCHAPLAVREGLTSDGLNLADVPPEFQGVTCYFCHNAVGLEADHNGKVTLANDQTMRGSLHDAVDPGVHAVQYSTLHDRDSVQSSVFCGSCHDVVTPKGVHLERTFAEYNESGFSKVGTPPFETCTGCHMDVSRSGAPVAVMPGRELPKRKMHEHLWPGVDVALSDDFPDQAAQRKAVECALMNGTVSLELQATNPVFTAFKLTLEAQMGHAQPSGAAQDRRLWLEFIAYDAQDNVLFQTGVIADGAVEELPEGDPGHDPYLSMFRDRIFDAMGQEVHMFWDAEMSATYPTGFTSNVLPLAVMVPGRHVKEVEIVLPRDIKALPARVSARLLMRPVGMDILNDLVASGDLAPEVLARVPTFALHGTNIEWTTEDGPESVTQVVDPPLDCPDAYLELLQ